MSPTQAAVEHLRLQREYEAARKSGDNERIERAHDALLKFVAQRYEDGSK